MSIEGGAGRIVEKSGLVDGEGSGDAGREPASVGVAREEQATVPRGATDKWAVAAFAQIVFTATGVTPATIKRVRFLIEGEPIVAATGSEQAPAAGEPVSRADYPTFEASIASSTTEVGSN